MYVLGSGDLGVRRALVSLLDQGRARVHGRPFDVDRWGRGWIDGPRRIPSGPALPEIETSTEEVRVVKQVASGRRVLLDMVRPYRKRTTGLAALTFVGALVEAGFLVLLTASVLAVADGAKTIGPIQGISVPLQWAVAFGGVLVVIRLLLSLAAARLGASLTARVTSDQRRRLGRAYLGAAWSVQQNEPSGRLQELVGNFVSKTSQTVTALNQGLTAVLNLVAFIGTGLVVDRVATSTMLLALGLLGVVITPVRRRIRRASASLATSNLAFSRRIAEFGSLGLEMRAFGVRDSFVRQLDAASDEQVAGVRRIQVLTASLTPLYSFLAYGAILLGVAVLAALDGVRLAAVGAVMLLLLRSLSYGQQLVTVQGQIASTLPFLERLRGAVDMYEESSAPAGSQTPSVVGDIVVDSVSLRYASTRSEALRDVSIRIGRGEMMGFIGPSGAGKSSFAQLVLGLREPTEGLLTVSGIDLRDIDRDWWSSRTAFVAQEALLVSGTVAENIRFFREGISDAALRDSARRANVLSDIEALSHGFDTDLGERGSQLSGGQKQRLSIARALAGDPELLVLDEPTSALDGHSEALIRATLAELHGRITVILIAHRLTTLDLCDRIAVLESARLTGVGPPLELQRTNAFYRRALELSVLDPSPS